MRGITLSEDFVKQIVGANSTKKISESTEAPKAEAHVCPLCESQLAEPISDEKIQEHVDYFLDVINENFDIVGEDINEEEEVEGPGDEEEESDELESEDEAKESEKE